MVLFNLAWKDYRCWVELCVYVCRDLVFTWRKDASCCLNLHIWKIKSLRVNWAYVLAKQLKAFVASKKIPIPELDELHFRKLASLHHVPVLPWQQRGLHFINKTGTARWCEVFLVMHTINLWNPEEMRGKFTDGISGQPLQLAFKIAIGVAGIAQWSSASCPVVAPGLEDQTSVYPYNSSSMMCRGKKISEVHWHQALLRK